MPAFNASQKELLVLEMVRKETLRALFIFLLVSNVFLFLRFFLRIFGADPQNAFASFIFLISNLFLLPFFGIFPHFRDQIVAGQMAFDFSAMTAGFCYNILIILIMCVIQIITSMVRTRKQTHETVDKGKPIDTQPIEQT
jgi:hypothetical protein